MNYLRFLMSNAGSSVGWGFGITLLGYGANSIPGLKDSSRLIAAFFILLTIAVTVKNYVKSKKNLAKI